MNDSVKDRGCPAEGTSSEKARGLARPSKLSARKRGGCT